MGLSHLDVSSGIRDGTGMERSRRQPVLSDEQMTLMAVEGASNWKLVCAAEPGIVPVSNTEFKMPLAQASFFYHMRPALLGGCRLGHQLFS